MRRRGEWVHIDDVQVYRVSSVAEFKAKLEALEGEPSPKVVTLWSLVRTAAQRGGSMRELVAA